MLPSSHERIDEVNDKLRLIQKTDGLTFGTDALLLAAYTSARGERALELGGGSGIVSMLLAARNRFSHIDCVEIQSSYVDLISRNLALNGLSEHITAIEADVRQFPLKTEKGSYDAVFSNPPYMTATCGAHCQNDAKTIARHETNGGIFDFVACAARALRWGGSFFCVFRPERLTDLLSACRMSRLEPKKMTLVHAREELSPSMLLLEARAGGKPGLSVTPPLILLKDGKDSSEMAYILENGIMPKGF